jgi:hypothetical protein
MPENKELLELLYEKAKVNESLKDDYGKIKYPEFKKLFSESDDNRLAIYGDFADAGLITKEAVPFSKFSEKLGFPSQKQPIGVLRGEGSPNMVTSQEMMMPPAALGGVQMEDVSDGVEEEEFVAEPPKKKVGGSFGLPDAQSVGGIPLVPTEDMRPKEFTPNFNQFKNEKALQQSAQSPAFKDYSIAQGVLEDREKLYSDSPLIENQNEYGRWDVQQFSADGNEVIKTLGTYDTREQAQKAIRATQRQAAPSGLIFPFKDDEEGFKKRPQAVQDEALRKAGVDVDANKPKVKALESIANSASNFLNRVEGTYPRINILADDLLESTLGRTAANFIRYTDPREGGDGLSIEQRRAKNYKILDELAAKIKPVNEFTDVVPAGDIAGIAAATFDAVSSFASTLATGAMTGGVGIIPDMIGDSIYSYNKEKAKSLGLTEEQLYDQGKNDFGIPALIGTTAGVLEKWGVKGITKAINKRLTGEVAKDLVEFGFETNKEAATEWVQTGLETFNTSLAKGVGAQQAAEDAFDVMLSKQGLEAALKGKAGGGVAVGIGRALKPKEAGAQAQPTQQEEVTGDGSTRRVVVDSIEQVPAEYRDSAVEVTTGPPILGRMGIGTKKQYAYNVPVQTIEVGEQTPEQQQKPQKRTVMTIDDILKLSNANKSDRLSAINDRLLKINAARKQGEILEDEQPGEWKRLNEQKKELEQALKNRPDPTTASQEEVEAALEADIAGDVDPESLRGIAPDAYVDELARNVQGLREVFGGEEATTTAEESPIQAVAQLENILAQPDVTIETIEGLAQEIENADLTTEEKAGMLQMLNQKFIQLQNESQPAPQTVVSPNIVADGGTAVAETDIVAGANENVPARQVDTSDVVVDDSVSGTGDVVVAEEGDGARQQVGTAENFGSKKASLDEKAKKLGYIGIKQFNAQNQLNENLTDAEKALLQEYSDFQQEIKNLKDENVIAKLSDDEFSTWSKANDITRDDLGKVVKDEEIELAAKRIRILNARGDSKKAESEFKKLKESKKKDNWTIESWKERFDEDVEQSEIDEINQSNKVFNDLLDNAVKSFEQTTPTSAPAKPKAEPAKTTESKAKSSWESNIEALINPESGMAATIRKMDIGQKEKDAFLERIGLTKEGYNKLDAKGKQKIQDQWVKSKEFESLLSKEPTPSGTKTAQQPAQQTAPAKAKAAKAQIEGEGKEKTITLTHYSREGLRDMDNPISFFDEKITEKEPDGDFIETPKGFIEEAKEVVKIAVPESKIYRGGDKAIDQMIAKSPDFVFDTRRTRDRWTNNDRKLFDALKEKGYLGFKYPKGNRYANEVAFLSSKEIENYIVKEKAEKAPPKKRGKKIPKPTTNEGAIKILEENLDITEDEAKDVLSKFNNVREKDGYLKAYNQLLKQDPDTILDSFDDTNSQEKALGQKVADWAKENFNVTQAAKDIADRIRSKKIDGALSSFDFGLTPAIYNGALEFMASQVEKGTKLGNAIANTLKWIDEQMKGAKWNKGAFGKYMNDTYSVTLSDGREVEVIRDDSKQAAEAINGWYQPIEQAILDTKEDKLPANKWAERLRSKEDEDLWTGVREFLADKGTQPVTKQELKDFIKDNRVEIVEVVKGSDILTEKQKLDALGYKKVLNQEETDYAGNDVFDIQNQYGRTLATGDQNFISEWLDEEGLRSEQDNTKFSQYQLEGEKENYKEVLVTMPRRNNLDIISNEIYQKQYSQLNPEERVAVKRKARERGETVDESNLFKSSHFDEPNILVHLRMNTRKDADGNKVLFLEEVQSDWGQKGKKEGFNFAGNFDKSKVTTKEDGDFIEIYYDGKWVDKLLTTYSTKEEIQKDILRSAEFQFKARKKTERAGIVPAPFVTDTNSWVKLGLKAALKEAVAQGADKIAWSTGTQQFDRWGSEEISWRKNPTRTPKEEARLKEIADKIVNYKETDQDRVEYEKLLRKEGGWGVLINEQTTGATAFNGQEAGNKDDVSIQSKEDLRKAIKRNLSRERNDAEIDKLTDRIWNRMQTEDSGTSLPRKEGMEEFYGVPADMKRAKDFTIKKEGELFAVKDEKGKTIRTFKQENEANKFKENFGLGIVGNIAKSLFGQEVGTVQLGGKKGSITRSQALSIINDGGRVFTELRGDEYPLNTVGDVMEANNYYTKDSESQTQSTQPSITITPALRKSVEAGLPLFGDAKAKARIAAIESTIGKQANNLFEATAMATEWAYLNIMVYGQKAAKAARRQLIKLLEQSGFAAKSAAEIAVDAFNKAQKAMKQGAIKWLDGQIKDLEDFIKGGNLQVGMDFGTSKLWVSGLKALRNAINAGADLDTELSKMESKMAAAKVSEKITKGYIDAFREALIKATPTAQEQVKKSAPTTEQVVRKAEKATKELRDKIINDAKVAAKAEKNATDKAKVYIKAFSDYIKERLPEGVGKQIANAFNGLLTSPRALVAALDYVDKVAENKNFGKMVSEATKAFNRVQSMANSPKLSLLDVSAIAQMQPINFKQVSPETLQELTEQLDAFRTARSTGKSFDNRDLIKAYDKAKKEADDVKRIADDLALLDMQDTFNELKEAGELPSEIETFEDYQAYLEGAKPDSKTKEGSKVATENMAALQKKASTMIAIAFAEERENATFENQSITYTTLRALRDADLTLLDYDGLVQLNNALDNYFAEGVLTNAGEALIDIQIKENFKRALPKGKVKGFLTSKELAELSIAGIIQKLASMGVSIEKARVLLITPFDKVFSNTKEQFENARLAFDRKVRELKVTEADINKINIFGTLNEKSPDRSFEDKLIAIREGIKNAIDLYKGRDALVSRSALADAMATAKAMVEMGLATQNADGTINIIEGAKLQLDEKSTALYDYARAQIEALLPKMRESLRVNSGKDFTPIENYWPLSFVALKTSVKEDTNEILNELGMAQLSSYKSSKISSEVAERNRGRKGLNVTDGYYQLVGRDVFLTGLWDAMTTANILGAYNYERKITNSNLIKDAIPDQSTGANIQKAIGEYVSGALSENIYQGVNIKKTLAEQVYREVASNITRSVLNEPTQILKQNTSLFVSFAHSPTAFMKAIAIQLGSLKGEGWHRSYKQAIMKNTTFGARVYADIIQSAIEEETDNMPLYIYKKAQKIANALTGGNILIPLDSFVSSTAHLTGYIAYMDAADKKATFNADKLNDEALAASEQLQAKSNSENLKSAYAKVIKEDVNRYMWFLQTMQKTTFEMAITSWNQMFDPNVDSRTRRESFRNAAGYFSMQVTFSLFRQMLIPMLLEAGIEWITGDDEEEDEKAKAKKLQDRGIRAGVDIGLSYLLGRYNSIIQMGIKLGLATSEVYYRKALQEGKDPFDKEDKTLLNDPQRRLIYTDEAAAKAELLYSTLKKAGDKLTDKEKEAGQRALDAALAVAPSIAGLGGVNKMMNAYDAKVKADDKELKEALSTFRKDYPVEAKDYFSQYNKQGIPSDFYKNFVISKEEGYVLLPPSVSKVYYQTYNKKFEELKAIYKAENWQEKAKEYNEKIKDTGLPLAQNVFYVKPEKLKDEMYKVATKAAHAEALGAALKDYPKNTPLPYFGSKKQVIK